VIRKRRNGLQVQVYAGRDPLTGRKRWVSRQVPGQTKRSYREAKKIEAELLEQVDRGQHRGSSSRTVAELIERWLGWRQQVRPISPVTVANYRGAIDRYILPNLGRAKVQQVDASTIDALYEHVRARGGKCRHCWQRVRRGSPPLRVGERYRARPGADESKPASPDGVTHRFQQLAARLGVRARLHDLRHFMVTQLVAGGVDWRTVSGRAGHADGHMTLGTYAHFQQAQDRQAAEFMDRLLGAAATDSR
jgi:integrase